MLRAMNHAMQVVLSTLYLIVTYLACIIFMLYVLKSVMFESMCSHCRSLIIPSGTFRQTSVAGNY